MSYKRTTVSLSPDIIALAEKVMKARKFSDFSGFVAQLIREDWEKRHGVMKLTEPAPEPPDRPKGVGAKRKRSARNGDAPPTSQ